MHMPCTHVCKPHGRSWFAQVKGRKRWVLHPPSAERPCNVMEGERCAMVGRRGPESLVCEAAWGDVMYIPEGWWHETCSLDPFSVGVGALLEDSDSTLPRGHNRTCPTSSYRTQELSFCQNHECAEMLKLD